MTETTKTTARTSNSTCPHTGVRRASCACSRCYRNETTDEKMAANLRDIRALLGVVDGFAANVLSARNNNTWADVGDAARLRESLIDIVCGLGDSHDPDDRSHRDGIEAALATDDVDVSDALICAL